MPRFYKGFFVYITTHAGDRGQGWSATAEVTPADGTQRLHGLSSRTDGHDTEASAIAVAHKLSQTAIDVELEVRQHMP